MQNNNNKNKRATCQQTVEDDSEQVSSDLPNFEAAAAEGLFARS